MSVDIVADKYSTAIFELASENNILEQLEEDLSYVRQVLQEQSELQSVLTHPVVESAKKCKLIETIFGQAIHKLALQFLYVMINRRRERYIVPAIEGYISKSREARKILEVKVTVSAPLTAETEAKLCRKLESLTGKTVILDLRQNFDIMGGMIVQIGDKRIDASVARSLEEMKKALLKAGTTKIGVNG